MSGGQNENAAKISNQVKKKINELRDELDKTKELLKKANQVAEDEKKAREQVSLPGKMGYQRVKRWIT